MRLTVFTLCLWAAIIGIFGDSANGEGASSSGTASVSTKRESHDEHAVADRQGAQSYHPGVAHQGYIFAAAPSQLSYLRPEGAIQYAGNGFRGSYLTQSPFLIPQVAYAAPNPEIKSAGAPIQLAYAHPGPIQYAIALAPPSAAGGQSSVLQQAAAIPMHGHHFQYALAPMPQPVGQIVKGGGVAYAQVPQVAYLASPSYAKVPAQAPQILAAPQSPPAYAYSIQPSIQVAASKQVISPTVAPQHYKALVTPPATSYATFSQQLPTSNGVQPVKFGSVVSQPVYATTAAPPVYSTPKVTYRSIAPSVQQTVQYTSNPGSFYYGSHLYHPSLAKFANLLAQKYY